MSSLHEEQDIGLIDLDGTLCDYDRSLQEEMEKLASPEEAHEVTGYGNDHPPHIWARMKLIKERGDWWENLPKFKLGFDVLDILKEMDFYISILTQGPRVNPVAWSHKVAWCMKNVPELDITITRNKGLVYGKVLVDDYPEYVMQWLKYRPRGLVIMPAQKWNTPEKVAEMIAKMDEGTIFPWERVVRYDGTNLEEVRAVLKKVKDRKPNEQWGK